MFGVHEGCVTWEKAFGVVNCKLAAMFRRAGEGNKRLRFVGLENLLAMSY